MEKQQTPFVIAKLIAKFLKNELSDSEKNEFETWLNNDPNNAVLLESFKKTKQVQKEIDYINAINVEREWDMISKKIRSNKPSYKFNWTKAIRYGSVAILLISLGIGIYTYKSYQIINNHNLVKQKNYHDILPGSSKALIQLANGIEINLTQTSKISNKDIETKNGFVIYKNANNQKKGYNSLATPRAGEYKTILPDGTKVFLNSSSTIKFSTNFNTTERYVQLVGEAYFEVTHNEKLPFIVNFNHTDVEVLGTHFNISSYKNTSRTTLLEGAIKITTANKQTLLKPGYQASILNGSVQVAKADTYKSIAWKEGMFYFNNDSITEILEQVARWYDVEIKYNGIPSTKKYSGDIRRQATLNQVIEMLTAVSGVTFTLKERNLTVNF